MGVRHFSVVGVNLLLLIVWWFVMFWFVVGIWY